MTQRRVCPLYGIEFSRTSRSNSGSARETIKNVIIFSPICTAELAGFYACRVRGVARGPRPSASARAKLGSCNDITRRTRIYTTLAVSFSLYRIVYTNNLHASQSRNDNNIIIIISRKKTREVTDDGAAAADTTTPDIITTTIII